METTQMVMKTMVYWVIIAVVISSAMGPTDKSPEEMRVFIQQTESSDKIEAELSAIRNKEKTRARMEFALWILAATVYFEIFIYPRIVSKEKSN